MRSRNVLLCAVILSLVTSTAFGGDLNWGYVYLPDAVEPTPPDPTNLDEPLPDPCEVSGSIIDCQAQTLGERIPIVGTPFSLNYRTTRVPGRKGAYTLKIPLSESTVPASLLSIVLEISVAGQHFTYNFSNEPNQSTTFTWDGKDAYGRIVQGK